MAAEENGATIKAGLLTVKNNEIILMDCLNMSGITLKAGEIQSITITKKRSVFNSKSFRVKVQPVSSELSPRILPLSEMCQAIRRTPADSVLA